MQQTYQGAGKRPGQWKKDKKSEKNQKNRAEFKANQCRI